MLTSYMNSSSQIIGPALFGITYMKTVAILPKTIFFVSAGCITLSFICLSFVRIDKLSQPKDQEAAVVIPVPRVHGVDREETLVGGDSSALEDRNSRTKKAAQPTTLIEVAWFFVSRCVIKDVLLLSNGLLTERRIDGVLIQLQETNRENENMTAMMWLKITCDASVLNAYAG